jgi:phosphatidylglycerophosphate synthase
MNPTPKNFNLQEKNSVVMDSISRDRVRTNLLRKPEQKAIAYFVQRIPSWISSNMLTAIGFSGSIVVFLSFILATSLQRSYLLLGVLGFAISWFGDSLDGRIAYFRKKSRKWYGFVLDISFDWIGIILIGCGYIVYVEGPWELLGYSFIVMYAWEIIIALMRYKITGNYSIDSGIFGPTEVRIIISAILVAEVLFPDSIIYSVALICILLLVSDIADTRKLSKVADELDKKEKEKKLQEENRQESLK